MRNIQLIFISVLTLLAFTGCNDDDFLVEKPRTIYTIDNSFEKSSQVDAQLVRAYRSFRDLHGFGADFNPGMNNSNMLMGAGADYFDNTPFLVGTSGYSNYALWNANSGYFSGIWNALYQLISYANVTLYGAESVEWDSDADKEYAIAQAKFFRGWSYLRLAECFGGVPLVDTISYDLKLDYTRATRSATYELAISDLIDAVAGLPDFPLEDGRLADGAANHYLAEAYLGLGIESGDNSNYPLAIAAATAVIEDHPLMTSRFGTRANPSDMGTNNGVPNYRPDGNTFFDLFQIGNYDFSTGNSEAVLVLQGSDYDTYQANRVGSGFGASTPPVFSEQTIGPVFRDMRWRDDLATNESSSPFTGDIDIDAYPGGSNSAYLGGFSWGRVALTKYAYKKVWAGVFANGDMRNEPINICREFLCLDRNHPLYNTYVTSDMVVDTTERFFPLYSKTAMQDGWGWHSSVTNFTTQYGRDLYAVRSAETYLLRAEAHLRNGSPDLATADVNAIRTRAGATYMYPTVDIYDILDERAREVIYEEHRFPQLLRIGGDVLVNQLLNNALFVADKPTYTGQISWRLFPIPLTVIQMNTDAVMEQNPGW